MSPVDVSTLEAAKAAIHKRHPGIVTTAESYPIVPRIPTGSYELDFATSGGIPIGRWSRFVGAYSSSKSLTTLNIIAAAQKQGMKCALYDVEKAFDKEHAVARGVNLADLELVQETVMENLGEQMEALLGSVHLHILDSTSSAVSIEELNADMADWQMGLSGRVWGKVFRNIMSHWDPSPEGNTGIMISQVRDAIGKYGGGEVVIGGRFLEHTSSMTVHFRRGKWLYYDNDKVLEEEKDDHSLSGRVEPHGIEVMANVSKSRVCPQGRTARMRLDFKSMNWDTTYELVKAAKYFNVVEGKGAWFTLPDGNKVQGNKNLRKTLEEDTALRSMVEDALKRNW